MSMNASQHEPHPTAASALPFVAPCRSLRAVAPLRWVANGWADFCRAPRVSLIYGAAIVVLSWLVTAIGLRYGSYWAALMLLSGFVFVAPVLAIGLYSISRQLQRGVTPSLARSASDLKRTLGNAMVFAIGLLIVFLIWARAGSMVHVFFPVKANPDLNQLLPFLVIGSAVGSIFAGLTFLFSAFSLPMMCDRDTDAVTAVVTSVNAVLRNKRAMVLWVMMIVGLTALGFATALLGLALVIPLLGYATWHGYEETVDAGAWPANDGL